MKALPRLVKTGKVVGSDVGPQAPKAAKKMTKQERIRAETFSPKNFKSVTTTPGMTVLGHRTGPWQTANFERKTKNPFMHNAKGAVDVKNVGGKPTRGKEVYVEPSVNWGNVQLAGLGVGTAGTTAAVVANENAKYNKNKKAQAKKLVSKRQRDPVKENKSLIRAKRTAVATSLTSGALGLGSLGALGASAALKRPEIARQVATRVPKLKNTADVSRKLGSAAVVGTTASAGIGGAGSLNFAGVQAKEARKLKEETMRKSYTPGLDFGTSGVHQGENVEIIEKRNKRFDGEKKRERRLELYSQGSTAAGGGLLTGAGVMGAKAVGQKPGTRWKPTKPGGTTYQATDFAGTGLRSTQKAQWVKGAKQAGKAGAVGLTGVGALVAGDRIKQYRKGKGRAWS